MDEHLTEDDTNAEVQARKRWCDDDDMILLNQVHTDRPFLAQRHITKAWNKLAVAIRGVDGFTRRFITGKQAAHRFNRLVKQHAVLQQTSTSEEEAGKMSLLGELVALVKDNEKSKISMRATRPIEDEDGARFIRNEAVPRGGRPTEKDASDTDDAPPPSKKRTVLEVQEMVIELEKEKLAFKKAKFERELEEREKEREERRQVREMETKRYDAMMALVHHLEAEIMRVELT
ncbi:Aste57867_1629 [Aphanomyces stellatus]|uniref:Aste57867_1629 protein n=1 Tax=Aphanomyces stellatus TaxID=120398 RepID=A0A485KB35_9STRA|nr:hypothetical protein As57867_001627 [Aphanomyces stellatus]VFT78842.1 Aste57867_1629 [Aphanomyces stellatus]